MAVWLIRRSPSDFTVASCLGLMPMMLFVSVTLSFLFARGRLHPVTVRASSHRVQILEPLDPSERVDRRLEHVVRIVGAERLRQDVLDAGGFEDGPHSAARDDPGPGDGGLEEH